MTKMMKRVFAAFAFALSALVIVPAASAGDPQIDAAISKGIVGEQLDGYLGFVKIQEVDPALKRKVDEVNSKRRSLYQQLAKQAGATPAQVALVTGIKQIEKSAPSDMVIDSTGSWVRAENAKLPD